ncbi:mitochondrial import inner membrane translocase subunit Tim29 [Synchiropus picturatus]
MCACLVSRRLFCAVAKSASPPASSSRWQKLKDSKAGVWCRSLLSDYKEAFQDIFVSARKRPGKTAVYTMVLGASSAFVYTKPDDASFQERLLDCSNQLGLLSPWIRSPPSDGSVQFLMRMRNEGRLRHVSLALLSLVYLADYDPDTSLYEAQCSDLSVPWRELPQRLLDVGFAGRWWILESKMRDYDVNNDEFKHLPAHLQQTSPPSVQQVDESERLHKESWLPVRMEEDEIPEVK